MTEVTPKRSPSGRQIGWLAFHWAAVLPAVLVVLSYCVFGFQVEKLELAIAALSASTAVVIGAFFATGMVRSGMDDLTFIRGTTTTRIVAVTWVVVFFGAFAAVVLIDIFQSLAGEQVSAGGFLGRWIDSAFTTIFGIALLVAVLGFGLTEYWEARAKSDRPIQRR